MGNINNKSDLVVIEEAEEGENFLTSARFSDALDVAISTSSKLVFEADEKGDKEAKEAVASINKYAKNAKKQINDEFKNQTSTLSGHKSELLEKVGTLLTISKSIIDQSAERREAKLKEIKELLILELAHAWNDSGVRCDFQCDLIAVDKAIMLSSLTAKGALTKKAKDYIQAVCEQGLKKQNLIDSRHQSLKIKCFEAGIDGNAITADYIGNSFYGDEGEFITRVDTLIKYEVDKKQGEIERIERESKKAVDDALAKQKVDIENELAEKARKEKADKDKEIDNLGANNTGAENIYEGKIKSVTISQDVREEKININASKGSQTWDEAAEKGGFVSEIDTENINTPIEDQKFSGVSGKGEIITEDELEKEVIKNGKKKIEIVVNLSVIVPEQMTTEFIKSKVESELSDLLSDWLDSVYVRESE